MTPNAALRPTVAPSEPMPALDFNRLFSERARAIQSSAIREILKVTERPEVISFAGGLPSPLTFPVDGRYMSDPQNNQLSSLQVLPAAPPGEPEYLDDASQQTQRPAPEYVNIRHRVMPNGQITFITECGPPSQFAARPRKVHIPSSLRTNARVLRYTGSSMAQAQM